MKQSFPASHAVPISKAVRAGDFVFTSAFGPWLFNPADLTYADDGKVLADGSGKEDMPFEEQVHATFGFISSALEVAGCDLSDVVQMDCWLADPRDFMAFNKCYAPYFPKDPPVRTTFPTQFNFACRVEMRAVAYKPLNGK
jgi:2-iminobutanoate/2-iminopropanoate deaminase